MKPSPALLLGVLLAAQGTTGAVASFRTGVTATVISRGGGRDCAEVTLRWVAFPAAATYGVQVSTEPDRGWQQATNDSTCAREGNTARMQAHPQSQTVRLAAAPSRRFFRISALDGAGRPLDFTSPLLVELKK